jgi:GGDEF domain-containing protein
VAGQDKIAHRFLNTAKAFLGRMPWLKETAALYAAAAVVNVAFFAADPGFAHARFNPLWIPVLLLSARYGFWPGLVSGVTAAVFLTLGVTHGQLSRSLIEQAAESGLLWTAGGFMSAGTVMGLIAQGPIDRHAKLAKANQAAIERENLATRLLAKSEEARRLLENRIVGETRTMRTVYDASRRLESLKAEDIYQGSLGILVEHFNVKRVSFYLLDGDHLLLKAAAGAGEGGVGEGKLALEKTILSACLEEKRTLTVRDLLKRKDLNRFIDQNELPLAMIPVADADGQSIGVISIEKMDFIHLNRANVDLMELVAEWTARALESIRAVDEVRRDRIHDLLSGLGSDAWFDRALAAEFARAAAEKRPLSVVLVKVKGFGFLAVEQQRLALRTLAAETQRLLRPWEFAARYRWDGVVALLLPGSGAEAAADKIRLLEKSVGAASEGAGWSVTCTAAAAGAEDQTTEDLLKRLEAAAGLKRRSG